MNCMKCGREIKDDQAFCPACLEEMEKYPVKHDVVVNLPRRRAPVQKKPAPRTRTPEEQIVRLKRRIRWLAACLLIMTVINALLVFLSIDVIRQLDIQRFLGQNYSTVETVD